uniref:Uncharacterized protein n=1 Tax=Glossina palpalis gambiensis TaxID=67801 RepID=A0A1B0AMZ3_9MUSC
MGSSRTPIGLTRNKFSRNMLLLSNLLIIVVIIQTCGQLQTVNAKDYSLFWPPYNPFLESPRLRISYNGRIQTDWSSKKSKKKDRTMRMYELMPGITTSVGARRTVLEVKEEKKFYKT